MLSQNLSKSLYHLTIIIAHFLLLTSSIDIFWVNTKGLNGFPGKAKERVPIVFNIMACCQSTILIASTIFNWKKELKLSWLLTTFSFILVSISLHTNNINNNVVNDDKDTWQFAFQWCTFCLYFLASCLFGWIYYADHDDDCDSNPCYM
jgi:hypothetical protein